MMKNWFFILPLALFAAGCADDGSLSDEEHSNPLSEWVIPETVHAGGEGVIQWNGFSDTDALFLVSDEGEEYALEIGTVTASGLMFYVPSDVPAGVYMLVLQNDERTELGNVTVAEPLMPVTGLKVPSDGCRGDEVAVSGIGFVQGCRVVLEDEAGKRTFIDAELTDLGISFVIPGDMVKGEYALYLEQDGFLWLLSRSFDVYADMSVKTLRGLRYDAPYVGKQRWIVEWNVSLEDNATLTLSEYVADGEEMELNAYDEYVCTGDGVFVLATDGREASNDMEISYVRNEEGDVVQSDVLIFGDDEPTPFAWTYDDYGRLTDISSPSMSFRSFEYDGDNMVRFGRVGFEYAGDMPAANPSASDVIWGYMAMQEPNDPFVYFPYLLGWYDVKSESLPSSIVRPSPEGTGTVVYKPSYEFDDEGYVVRMSWTEDASEYHLEYLY